MTIFRPLMASYLPYPNYLTKPYYIILYIYISIKFQVNTKHRTHKDFPSYRFYSDGGIMNITSLRYEAKGKRRSITVQKYFAQLFPNLYAWEDLRGKPTYTPIKVSDRKYSSLRPYRRRQIIKLGMNIPYRLFIKDKPSDQVIINIDRVIIRK